MPETSIDQRISKLERSLSRWRILTLLAGGILLLTAGNNAPPQEIRLQSADGQMTATLTPDSLLFEQKGSPRAGLGNIEGQGWGLVLFDAKGRARQMNLVLEGGETPAIALMDEAGTARVWLAQNPQSAEVRLADDKGTERAALKLDAAGATRLHLADAKGGPRVITSLAPDGRTGGFILGHATEDRNLGLLAIGEEGNPLLFLYDKQGTLRVGAGVGDNDSIVGVVGPGSAGKAEIVVDGATPEVRLHKPDGTRKVFAF